MKYVIVLVLVGVIYLFIASLMAVSGKASREEEKRYKEEQKKKRKE